LSKTTVIIIAFAIFAGIISSLLVRNILYLNPTVEQSKIVVASKNLTFGQSITVNELEEVPWSSTIVPEGSYVSITDIIKPGEAQRFALTTISKHAPIVASQITMPGQKPSLATLIADGKNAVTIRVDDVRGVAGFVMPGDRVDVALTRQEQMNNSSFYTDIILRNIKVLAIDQLAKDRQESAQIAKSVTLEVNSIEGEKLILASGAGAISLILRNTRDMSSSHVPRMTTSDLASEIMNSGRNNDLINENKSGDKSQNGKITTSIRLVRRGVEQYIIVPIQKNN
jgi:pilus assembly protein CpaB